MSEPYLGVFRNRSVFVTGHTGFVGSWLTLALLACGAQVTGYSLDPPTQPNLFSQVGIGTRIRDIRADVLDRQRLRRELIAASPEMVFHLAAQPIVRAAIVDPVLTFETNIIGTVNLLDTLRNIRSLRAVCVVTSDKCYALPDSRKALSEQDPMGGEDPYSSSKACEEIVARAFYKTFLEPQGMALATVRAGNIIGGGDWSEDRIVPDCIRALTQSRPVRLRNPDSIRPWQHVLDAVHGCLLLSGALYEHGSQFAGPWNFGPPPDTSVTVRELTELVLSEWGSGSYEIHREERSVESPYLSLDSTKSFRLLNWEPIFTLRDAIRQTVLWYRSFYSGSLGARPPEWWLAQLLAKAKRAPSRSS